MNVKVYTFRNKKSILLSAKNVHFYISRVYTLHYIKR